MEGAGDSSAQVKPESQPINIVVRVSPAKQWQHENMEHQCQTVVNGAIETCYLLNLPRPVVHARLSEEQDQTGNEVHFKIKTTTKFEKVLTAYCDKKSLDQKSVKFLFDGNRVSPESTPASLDMEDGDQVDCMIEQIGGSI